MAAAVLGLTLLAYWSLTVYEHVDWLEGEDGLSEWGRWLPSSSEAPQQAQRRGRYDRPSIVASWAVLLPHCSGIGFLRIRHGGDQLGPANIGLWHSGGPGRRQLAGRDHDPQPSGIGHHHFLRVLGQGGCLGRRFPSGRSASPEAKHHDESSFALPGTDPDTADDHDLAGRSRLGPRQHLQVDYGSLRLRSPRVRVPEVLLDLCIVLYTVSNLRTAWALRKANSPQRSPSAQRTSG